MQVDSLVWLKKEELSAFDRRALDTIKKRLTFVRKAFHPKSTDTIVENFVELEDGTLGLPLEFGQTFLRSYFSTTPAKHILSEGIPSGGLCNTSEPVPDHPMAPKGQSQFFSDLIDAAEKRIAILACAPTGTGKTAAALYLAARRGRRTLIIVPSVEIALQWIREIEKFLEIPSTSVDQLWAGGEWERKNFAVAVINTIAQKTFPKEFYRHFGIVVWDEAHRLGADSFSKTIHLFNARTRLALTATPSRKDGADTLFFDYFGEPSVVASSEAMPCDVRVINLPTMVYKWAQMGRARLIDRLTKDRERNASILKVVSTLYTRGRWIIILSDRVSHLQRLREFAFSLYNIPKIEMGLLTGFRWNDFEEEDKQIKHSSEDLADARRCRIVFATYGKGKEALDIPRLDAGIDVTPRADGIQGIGRIRRLHPEKKKPVWFTFRDVHIPLLVRYTTARIRDYRLSQNVTIYEA